MSKLFLGFDTSCYTTSVGVVDIDDSIIYEQRKLLEVPLGEKGLQQSVALFNHLKALPLLCKGLRELEGEICGVGASLYPRSVEGSYMPVFTAGASAGQMMADVLKVPFYGFSHQENHLRAALLGRKCPDSPFLFLQLSGGTTEILRAERDEKGFAFTLLGETLDISAGQLIDRVGVLLGLSFPAGAELEKLSQNFEGEISKKVLSIYQKDGNLSFSGMETKLKDFIVAEKYSHEEIARMTEVVVGESLGKSLSCIASKEGIGAIVFAGGVLSNERIRNILRQYLNGYNLIFAPEGLSRDHGIGVAALAKDAWVERKGDY